MRRKSRRPVIALATAVAALVLYFALRGDETARVREPVERITHALTHRPEQRSLAERNHRLEQELRTLLEPDVVLDIPDVSGVIKGHDGVIRLATRTGDVQQLDLALSDVMVSFDGAERTAQLRARIAAGAFRPGYESHELRNLSVQLVRRDAGWRIASVTVAMRTHEEPEARP